MDWNDFAKRLTLELTRLPVRSFLIVQGSSGLPYVQAMRSDGALDAEAVASVFLPRPLSSRQERRLAALGWERPDDGDRQNWWHHIAVRERGGRSTTADLLEECAMLAGRMTGAFRDVYLVGSPLELVYQASRSGPDEGPLALPGLGIPLALPEEDEPAESADLESILASARERGDQDGYLGLIAKAVLYLPSPGDPGAADHQYATARFGDGTFVLAFTSTDAMARSLRGQAVNNRSASLADLARDWPDPNWQLAINPGLPSAAYLDASVLLHPLDAPRDGDAAPSSGHGQAPRPPGPASNGRGTHSGPPSGQGSHRSAPGGPQAKRGPHTPQHGAGSGGRLGAHASSTGVGSPAPGTDAPLSEQPSAPRDHIAPPPAQGAQPPVQGARAVESGRGAAAGLVVMQKVIRPEHVPHYLDGGYDLVAGYVHRLQDVREMNSPARLVRGLGLIYQGSPFSTGDEAIHVIRWPAVKPPLFRRPLGGIDEWSMGIIPGGWVIEKAPFPGSGYAPGDGPPVPEFKTDSQRLPHGARMYRLSRSGTETLLAVFDGDQRRWIGHPAAGGRA
ncbi:TY-Chap domain-containing protein [Spirillospora sp. NBC_01491]|uniref:TY-Chap domain-containing protein n=1 Tax=Spirillospora sp. NBC_01491 TaxID=2976007 RepID=UPI002E306990|nr:SseB family protein [Spirillospora sp. NBC_01491]